MKFKKQRESGSSAPTSGKRRQPIRLKNTDPLPLLLEIMAALRSPNGCPWDKEQDHRSIRFHAIEEACELVDAIESGDDEEMVEELGDALLQVVFHSQLGRERGAFDFEAVCKSIAEKLIRRHPHVFGESDATTVDAVWTQWEQIKRGEKAGKRTERTSALDGVPRHLPALLRAEKIFKKARKAGLEVRARKVNLGSKKALGEALYDLVAEAQSRGWNAEELLRAKLKSAEKELRSQERKKSAAAKH